MTLPADSCPVCRGRKSELFAHVRDVEYFTTRERFTYLRCRHCQTVYLENPPVTRLHEIYPANYYSANSDFNQSLLHRVKDALERRMFGKILKRIPGDSLSVLDVGGGYGWMLNTIREADDRIRETFVLDFDESARQRAEAAGHVFYASRVEEFSSPRSYDLIVMLNIIEHVADPLRVMKVMSEVLSLEGAILIKTPNVDTLDRYLFQHRNWAGFHCPRHFVLFNRSNFTRLIRQCDLEMEWFSYTQGASQWTGSILGMLADRRLISCHKTRSVYEHPLWIPVATLAAAFDILRSPVSKTAQMFCLVKKRAASN